MARDTLGDMTTSSLRLIAAAALLLAAGSVGAQSPAPPPRVLVFSKTAGFRHSSIEPGIAAIRKLGQENGFAVDATEDAGAFTDRNLRQYQAVVFLSTTGDVLDARQQDAFPTQRRPQLASQRHSEKFFGNVIDRERLRCRGAGRRGPYCGATRPVAAFQISTQLTASARKKSRRVRARKQQPIVGFQRTYGAIEVRRIGSPNICHCATC